MPPELIRTQTIDVFRGLKTYHIRKVIKGWPLTEEEAGQIIKIVRNMYQLMVQLDAELVEINPLVRTSGGEIMALDAKVIINDNALYRQKQFERTPDHFDNELEFRASQYNLNYVKLDGNIGLLCTGAGLSLATIDLINDLGGKAANFLESGGANYSNAYNGMSLVLSDPQVKVLLINTFGLVSRADVICSGLAQVLSSMEVDIPIVAVIRGTGEEEARRIFRQELGLEPFDNMEEAVQHAVKLAR
jgi:succinyl-CoA synthetase beta subunit